MTWHSGGGYQRKYSVQDGGDDRCKESRDADEVKRSGWQGEPSDGLNETHVLFVLTGYDWDAQVFSG